MDAERLEKTGEESYNGLVSAAEGMEEYGWNFVLEENEVTVTRTSTAVRGANVKCTRGVAVIRAAPRSVFEKVRLVEEFTKWDSRCKEARVVEEYDENHSLIYMQFDPGFPGVSVRDVVFLQTCVRESPKEFSVAWESVKSPVKIKGRNKRAVRANFSSSGFVIRPLEKSSLVTFVLQFDLKGWIPNQMMDGLTAQFPLLLANVADSFPRGRARTATVDETPPRERPNGSDPLPRSGLAADSSKPKPDSARRPSLEPNTSAGPTVNRKAASLLELNEGEVPPPVPEPNTKPALKPRPNSRNSSKS